MARTGKAQRVVPSCLPFIPLMSYRNKPCNLHVNNICGVSNQSFMRPAAGCASFYKILNSAERLTTVRNNIWFLVNRRISQTVTTGDLFCQMVGLIL